MSNYDVYAEAAYVSLVRFFKIVFYINTTWQLVGILTVEALSKEPKHDAVEEDQEEDVLAEVLNKVLNELDPGLQRWVVLTDGLEQQASALRCRTIQNISQRWRSLSHVISLSEAQK